MASDVTAWQYSGMPGGMPPNNSEHPSMPGFVPHMQTVGAAFGKGSGAAFANASRGLMHGGVRPPWNMVAARTLPPANLTPASSPASVSWPSVLPLSVPLQTPPGQRYYMEEIINGMKSGDITIVSGVLSKAVGSNVSLPDNFLQTIKKWMDSRRQSVQSQRDATGGAPVDGPVSAPPQLVPGGSQLQAQLADALQQAATSPAGRAQAADALRAMIASKQQSGVSPPLVLPLQMGQFMRQPPLPEAAQPPPPAPMLVSASQTGAAGGMVARAGSSSKRPRGATKKKEEQGETPLGVVDEGFDATFSPTFDDVADKVEEAKSGVLAPAGNALWTTPAASGPHFSLPRPPPAPMSPGVFTALSGSGAPFSPTLGGLPPFSPLYSVPPLPGAPFSPTFPAVGSAPMSPMLSPQALDVGAPKELRPSVASRSTKANARRHARAAQSMQASGLDMPPPPLSEPSLVEIMAFLREQDEDSARISKIRSHFNPPATADHIRRTCAERPALFEVGPEAVKLLDPQKKESLRLLVGELVNPKIATVTAIKPEDVEERVSCAARHAVLCSPQDVLKLLIQLAKNTLKRTGPVGQGRYAANMPLFLACLIDRICYLQRQKHFGDVSPKKLRFEAVLGPALHAIIFHRWVLGVTPGSQFLANMLVTWERLGYFTSHNLEEPKKSLMLFLAYARWDGVPDPDRDSGVGWYKLVARQPGKDAEGCEAILPKSSSTLALQEAAIDGAHACAEADPEAEQRRQRVLHGLAQMGLYSEELMSANKHPVSDAQIAHAFDSASNASSMPLVLPFERSENSLFITSTPVIKSEADASDVTSRNPVLGGTDAFLAEPVGTTATSDLGSLDRLGEGCIPQDRTPVVSRDPTTPADANRGHTTPSERVGGTLPVEGEDAQSWVDDEDFLFGPQEPGVGSVGKRVETKEEPGTESFDSPSKRRRLASEVGGDLALSSAMAASDVVADGDLENLAGGVATQHTPAVSEVHTSTPQTRPGAVSNSHSQVNHR